MHLVINAGDLVYPQRSFYGLLAGIIDYALKQPETDAVTLLETHVGGPAVDRSLLPVHPKLKYKRVLFPVDWVRILGGALSLLRVESLVPGADVFFSMSIQATPRAVKIPAIVTVHDLTPLIFPKLMAGSVEPIRLKIKFIVDTADLIVVDSKHTRADLQRLFKVRPERVRVVPVGVDERFGPQKPDRSLLAERYGLTGDYLLYVGAVGLHKNVATLIKAFSVLAKRFDDLKLAIAGRDAEGAAKEKELAQSLGPADRVRFLGEIPSLDESDDLIHLYCGAKVFATASLYEGFGLPPIEAMACGTPVVCSNAASLPEAVGEAALTIEPLDAEGFAQNIRRILEDETLAAELRGRGFCQKEKFSAERMHRAYFELFSSAVSRAGPKS